MFSWLHSELMAPSVALSASWTAMRSTSAIVYTAFPPTMPTISRFVIIVR